MSTDRPPPWSAHNARERAAMVQWAHRKLDELQWAETQPDLETIEARAASYAAWYAADGPEIYSAEHGDIEPLRKKYPRLAPFLFAPPKRKQKKEQRVDLVATGVWAVKQIRKIWQEEEEYKRKNRRAEDGASAIEIAALWLQELAPDEEFVFTVESKETRKLMKAIEKKLKPSGPSGKKKKK